jgi:hypothetical protein
MLEFAGRSLLAGSCRGSSRARPAGPAARCRCAAVSAPSAGGGPPARRARAAPCRYDRYVARARRRGLRPQWVDASRCPRRAIAACCSRSTIRRHPRVVMGGVSGLQVLRRTARAFIAGREAISIDLCVRLEGLCASAADLRSAGTRRDGGRGRSSASRGHRLGDKSRSACALAAGRGGAIMIYLGRSRGRHGVPDANSLLASRRTRYAIGVGAPLRMPHKRTGRAGIRVETRCGGPAGYAFAQTPARRWSG